MKSNFLAWLFHFMKISQNVNVFLRTFVLSMVNTRLSLFSPYFRKFENDVLGYSFWWSPNDFELVWRKRRREKSRAKEECLCEAEEREWRAEAKEAFKEESYEKEFNRLKTRKEVRMMYSESILVGCDVR